MPPKSKTPTAKGSKEPTKKSAKGDDKAKKEPPKDLQVDKAVTLKLLCPLGSKIAALSSSNDVLSAARCTG